MPGVGKASARQLVKQLGSLRAVFQASKEQLQQVGRLWPGVLMGRRRSARSPPSSCVGSRQSSLLLSAAPLPHLQVEGVSAPAVENLLTWSALPANQELLQRLEAAGLQGFQAGSQQGSRRQQPAQPGGAAEQESARVQASSSSSGDAQPLRGMVLVLTGARSHLPPAGRRALQHLVPAACPVAQIHVTPACPPHVGASEFGPRQELASFLEQHGASVASSVSRNTSALLAGDKPGGSKFSKAQQLGVRVVPVAEFLREHGLKKGC